MTSSHYNTTDVRPPAVAGSFYPASAARLQQEIADYLKQAKQRLAHTPHMQARMQQRPLALIAPHAGYMYSGPIAGSAYALLSQWKKQIRRVVLLGPAHRVALEGVALPSVNYFETPLGEVPIDALTRTKLKQLPFVSLNDFAHAQEHSLEVHIPFLQSVLENFTLIPIVVGDIASTTVSKLIDALWDENTLILVSSDLSHYHDYHTAQELDGDTCNHILAGDPLTSYQQACGATPINALLLAAKQRKLHIELLDVRNSGDTAGDQARVVGYASFAFFQEPA